MRAGRREEADQLGEVADLLASMGADVLVLVEGEEQLLGLLAVRDDRVRDAFSAEDAALLAALAGQIAITVENSQAFQQMKERDRLAALGEMSAGLAHEIRNPLGAIKAAAQVIEEMAEEQGSPPRPDREFLGVIVEEVDRLNRVVSDFLSYARPSSGLPKEVDVNDILKRTIQLIETGRGHKASLVVDYGGDLAGVLIDGEKLHQVFLNLALNALQAMEGRDDAKLEIATRLKKMRRLHRIQSGVEPVRYVEIRFSDNGPGIEPEVLQRIFIPFYTTKTKGSGLGLSLCQRIIRDAGGDIEVRSQVGQGTIFTVVLPACGAERPSSAPPPNARGEDEGA